jgi:hypothetical protein
MRGSIDPACAEGARSSVSSRGLSNDGGGSGGIVLETAGATDARRREWGSRSNSSSAGSGRGAGGDLGRMASGSTRLVGRANDSAGAGCGALRTRPGTTTRVPHLGHFVL